MKPPEKIFMVRPKGRAITPCPPLNMPLLATVENENNGSISV